MTADVTAFKVTDHGVTVAATLVGHHWTFEWPGRNRDDKAMVWCAYATAETIAANICEQVATQLRPLRDELNRRQTDLAEWVMAHNPEEDHR